MLLRAYVRVYGLETMALIEKQQWKVHVCDINWAKIIVAVKRTDKRSFKMKWSRLKWPGHVETMGDGKLAKKADAQKEEEKRRQKDRDCDGRTNSDLEN